MRKNEGRTFILSEEYKFITCLVCGMTSYSPGDIENLYCGRCRQFHESMRLPDPPRFVRARFKRPEDVPELMCCGFAEDLCRAMADAWVLLDTKSRRETKVTCTVCGKDLGRQTLMRNLPIGPQTVTSEIVLEQVEILEGFDPVEFRERFTGRLN